MTPDEPCSWRVLVHGMTVVIVGNWRQASVDIHPMEMAIVIMIFTRTWLLYVLVLNLSVIYNIREPTQGGWNFQQYFSAILYLSHPLTSMQNFTGIIPGNPFLACVKCKRGSKIERRHVRVSYLLMSLCIITRNFVVQHTTVTKTTQHLCNTSTCT